MSTSFATCSAEGVHLRKLYKEIDGNFHKEDAYMDAVKTFDDQHCYIVIKKHIDEAIQKGEWYPKENLDCTWAMETMVSSNKTAYISPVPSRRIAIVEEVGVGVEVAVGVGVGVGIIIKSHLIIRMVMREGRYLYMFYLPE